MPRFFVAPEQIGADTILVTGEEARHIKTVLRAKMGEELTLCDGKGREYTGRICSFIEEGVLTEIVDFNQAAAEPVCKITLFQAMPKADKMDFIVQKCVELGVSEIVPMLTKRTIVKLDKAEKEEKRRQRWQKIAQSAAKQSGRGIVPAVSSAVPFQKAAEMAGSLDGAVIPYEMERKKGLHIFLEKFQGQTMGILIGPEGGFSEEEISFAAGKGILPVTLGKRILRTETAGMAVLAILLYELERREENGGIL